MTREEALEELDSLIIPRDGEQDKLADAFEMAIKALEQEPKTGRWINNQNGTYTCDKCGCKHSRSNYCPNCGSFNREREDKE